MASFMASQAVALVVLILLLGVAGVLNLRALLKLDQESRQKLVASMDGFRKFRILLLLAAIFVFRAKAVLLLSSLLVIITVSYAYQLVRLTRLDLPEAYLRQYRLSATVALVGMLTFTGLILLRG
jgi:hypothetical protein